MAKREMVGLVEKLQQTCERYQLLRHGSYVVVGFSGGADSTSLLHALVQHRDSMKLKVIAAHLHHGMRGAEADTDAEHCVRFAESLGIQCVVGSAKVPKIAADKHISVEEAGREERYALLEKVRVETKATHIATAHTLNDTIETVLLNIVRGTSIHGLSGIPYRRGHIVRPLLDVSRDETVDYCAKNKLETRLDITNLDLSRARSWIRLEMIPAIKEHLNPNLLESISRLSHIAREEEKLLETLAEQELRRLLNEDSPNTFHIQKLSALPLPLRRRVIRKAIEKLAGDIKDLEFQHLDAAARAVEVDKPFGQTVPGTGVSLQTKPCGENGQTLIIKLADKPPAQSTEELALIVGKSVLLNGATLTISVEVHDPNDHKRERHSSEVVIDAECVHGELRVRYWRQGDRIQPLGMKGSRKLSDIFIDAKINPMERLLLPIIMDDEGVVWAPRLAVADRVKISANTRHALLLSSR